MRIDRDIDRVPLADPPPLLRIFTEAFGLNEVVPQEFEVLCYVRRVQPVGAKMNLVALELDRSIADNMDFAFFVRQTQSGSAHDFAAQD